MTVIDARGLSCPQPVIMAKKFLESNVEDFSILVDNNTAKENVKRFMENSGFVVSITLKDDEYELTGKK